MPPRRLAGRAGQSANSAANRSRRPAGIGESIARAPRRCRRPAARRLTAMCERMRIMPRGSPDTTTRKPAIAATSLFCEMCRDTGLVTCLTSLRRYEQHGGPGRRGRPGGGVQREVVYPRRPIRGPQGRPGKAPSVRRDRDGSLGRSDLRALEDVLAAIAETRKSTRTKQRHSSSTTGMPRHRPPIVSVIAGGVRVNAKR